MFLAVMLFLLSVFTLGSCNKKDPGDDDIWDNAKYATDTTVGEGEKTVTVEIVVGNRSVTLTVKTDKDNLGAALYELGLINDATFFDTCNGMKADWDKDHAYWAFKQNGTMLNYGVGDAKINGGETFTIEYTK